LASGSEPHRGLLARDGGARAEAAGRAADDRRVGQDHRGARHALSGKASGAAFCRSGFSRDALSSGSAEASRLKSLLHSVVQYQATRVTARPSAFSTFLHSRGVPLTSTASSAGFSIGASCSESLYASCHAVTPYCASDFTLRAPTLCRS